MNTPPLNTVAAFLSMLAAQRKMNDLLRPSWETEDLDYPLAIAHEAIEGASHAGYEWWKKSPAHLMQARFEYVDAVHFYLSVLLKRYSYAALSKMLLTDEEHCAVLPARRRPSGMDNLEVDFQAVVAAARKVAHCALDLSADDLDSASDASINYLAEAFKHWASALKMDFAMAVSLYFAKNVLNGFRKANGYKEGTYLKTWMMGDGGCVPLEDNEVLGGMVEMCARAGHPLTSLAAASEYLLPLLASEYSRQIPLQLKESGHVR